VIDALFHIFIDYNRFARLGKWFTLCTKDTHYKLRTISSFKGAGFWLILISGLAAFAFGSSFPKTAAAQQLNTSTPTATSAGTKSGAYITVTYFEGTNVRTGPSSFDYPTIGHLSTGDVVPALGRSPAGEWIQIAFSDGPRGTGWVYAANVSVSPGALLQIVEPPPTPTLVMTPTINLTFVAAFKKSATPTRLPTFTAPPPLVIPTFSNPESPPSGRGFTTWAIIILGIIGVAGMILTSLRRR
jgi:hypothetical protein